MMLQRYHERRFAKEVEEVSLPLAQPEPVVVPTVEPAPPAVPADKPVAAEPKKNK